MAVNQASHASARRAWLGSPACGKTTLPAAGFTGLARRPAHLPNADHARCSKHRSAPPAPVFRTSSRRRPFALTLEANAEPLHAATGCRRPASTTTYPATATVPTWCVTAATLGQL